MPDIPAFLVQNPRGSGLRYTVDVVLQSRPPPNGPARNHPKAALGHGRTIEPLRGASTRVRFERHAVV